MANRFFLICFLIAASLLAACSSGGTAETALAVDDPWARPAPAGMNSAVYFVLENQGAADRLLSASSDVAEMVELHMSMTDEEGVMSMMEQESVEIPSGETVSFQPGGLHVMLIGLNQELRAGDSFPLTLQFEGAGQLEFTIEAKDQ